MNIQVTFRHLKSNQDLHNEAVEMAKKFEKFYDGITATDIIFKNESDTEKIVEFTVHINGHTLVSKVGSDDFQKSLSDASDKIIRQLRKRKEIISTKK